VVEVAAAQARAEAETIRRRLSGKGYPAFITTANAGGATMFRVRVGKYNDRQAAEGVKVKLEREERFKPWVTR
jgi:DedD protein